MNDYISEPSPDDILPREIVYNEDHVTLALALLPWVKRHRRFTFLGLLRVSGLKDQEMHKQHLVEKVRQAKYALGCKSEGLLPGHSHSKGWYFPDQVVLHPRVPERVTRDGYSEEATIPPPQPLQVEVCRAWLKEHARPTATIRRKFSTDSFRHFVTAWTLATGAYKDVEQVDDVTGKPFKADRIYVSNGAFLQAALDEGYLALRVPGGGDAWFNLIHRKTGQKWRGRPPGQVDAASRPVQAADLLDPAELRARLRRYIDVQVETAEELNLEPRFRSKAACIAVGIPVRKGQPPPYLVQALRELGWEARVSKVQGEPGRWWYRAGTPASPSVGASVPVARPSEST